MSKKEKAYQATNQAIIAGQLESTKIHTVSELSEAFEIGRTPAREALDILASEGLIDLIPRSGYQIRPLLIWDFMEILILHLRSVIEVEVPGLAAERISNKDIHMLEENNRQEQELALRLLKEVEA